MPPALRHGAVGSYPAFSPLPPTLAGGERFIFCDTVRQREFSLSTARVHHAARCLVVSGLSSKGYSEKQPPATVSGAASLSFNSLPLPATPEKGRRGQRAERAEAATKQFYGWLLHQASIGAETVVRAVPSAVKRTEKTGK